MYKLNKRIMLILFISFVVLFAVGCKGNGDTEVEDIDQNQGGNVMNLEQLKMPKDGEEVAIISTNFGDIKIRLFPDVAPKAVENFKTHIENGYYNGIMFHRVIKDFMIQGGDPQGTGAGGESIWGAPFEDEFDSNYHNFRGALSMANAGPGTNGSQFFIVQNSAVDKNLMNQMKELGEKSGFSEDVVKAYEELGGTPWLDFKHTVFGQVYEGMDIVDKIANVKVGANDKPVEPVIMEKVEIVKYK
ncbi:peptidylprolyl isomerase [Tissierella pigra]|uniref:Peptidyl-prolyl cis-trans isomerase n=2 Tax=Tissierella pigra TaxID=2607614 RepID=A0A6N7XYC7_9FIRM|nr:peptidylprolyl isomerase [Tissierella pigra]MSU01574.1 peptidylprolyl isomerase [Tissierella pigra]